MSFPFLRKRKEKFSRVSEYIFSLFFPSSLFNGSEEEREGRSRGQADSELFQILKISFTTSIPLDTSLRLSNNSIESHSREGGGGRGERRFRIPPDPLRSNFNLLRERERKGERREGGSVPLSPRANYSPLLSRPWPSKWPCNVTVNSITIGRAAQVTETGSARGKGEREREGERCSLVFRFWGGGGIYSFLI